MSLKYLSKSPAVLSQNVGVIRMDLLINLSIVNDNNFCYLDNNISLRSLGFWELYHPRRAYSVLKKYLCSN